MTVRESDNIDLVYVVSADNNGCCRVNTNECGIVTKPIDERGFVEVLFGSGHMYIQDRFLVLMKRRNT